MEKLPARIKISSEVLFRELEGEMVLLNLKNEFYYGLDEVGARMWQILMEHGEVEPAVRQLLLEYDVDETTLRQDMARLLGELLRAELISEEP